MKLVDGLLKFKQSHIYVPQGMLRLLDQVEAMNTLPMAKSLASVCTSKGLSNSMNLSTGGKDNLLLSPGSALSKYYKYTRACTKGVLFKTSMYKLYVQETYCHSIGSRCT